MRVLVRTAVMTALLLMIAAAFGLRSSSAQIPDEYKNLKVLPKDISKRELLDIMRSISQGVGMRCNECHVPGKGSDRLEDFDFASDDKKDKLTAREMLKMVDSINDQLGKMKLENPVHVRCVTCHHGVHKPMTLSQVVMATIDKGGIDSAIERYRKLRTEYYGSAAYDFSPGSLTETAGQLAETKKDYDSAVALLKLNQEFTPDDVPTLVTLGRVYVAKGDKSAAIASFEKALSLDPGNRWAKQQLDRVKGGE